MASMAAAVPLPLVFESNQGQTDPSVRFIARSPSSALFLLDDGGALLSLPGAGGETRHAVRMLLDGGETLPASEGVGAHGTSRYYRGNDPARWLSGVPTWDRAHYTAVYPGIDLVYYANDRRLEFDFIVSPGADPAAILLRFEGLTAKEGEKDLAVDGEGRLRLATPAGEVTLEAPRVYQDIAGARRTVAGHYQLAEAGKVRFAVGEYDASRPLVIDPVLTYSSYLGGSGATGWETIEELAVDANGNSIVVGYATTPDFPLVNPAFPTRPGGFDLHVTKVSADGSHVVYSTFLGSSPSPGETGTEWPGGIAVDAAGNAYVSGLTQGVNFPVLNAVQPVYGGNADMFVTKFSPAGALVYSTYLGGSSTDIPNWLWPSNLAVMPDGKAYVVGMTYSTDYPQVNGAQTSLSVDTAICATPETGTCADMVLTVLSPAGDQILYSTYWGGPDEEGPNSVAVDSTGAAYVLALGAVPTTPLVNPYKPEFSNGDLFIMKIRPDGTQPVYATFVRAENNAGAMDLDIDAEGAAYIVNQTFATDLPVPYAIQPVNAGANWYLTRINPRGTGIDYATYFGGTGFDVPWDLEVDAMGNVAITGYSLYGPFPVLRPLYPGIVQDDGFVVRIHPTGPTLLYSTPMGGGRALGVGFNPRGDVLLGGATGSTTFHLVNPFQPVYGGNGDAFFRRMADGFSTLATPSRIPAQAGDTITVPVLFTPGGANISSTILSIDFDESCLTFNPADPIVYNLPAGYFKSVSYNASDTDGEIDITLIDPAPPIVPLPLGELARLTFHVKPACGGTATSTLASVGFSSAPSVSFGASGQSKPGFSLDGSVEVLGGTRGDCNADQMIDAGDLDASVLELSDTDGSLWLDARLSTFLGSPVGCDANADTSIDAGDLSCIILMLFEGPEACASESLLLADVPEPLKAASFGPPALEVPARLRPGRDGEVLVPVTLRRGESRVNSVAFSLILPDSLSFDPTDADRDGIPDAVTFQLPLGFTGKVRWSPKNPAGQLAIFVFDTAGSRRPLPQGGKLAVVRLVAKGGATAEKPVRFGTSPSPSFGIDEGKSVRGVTRLEGETK
jgi:hypothetical protein